VIGDTPIDVIDAYGRGAARGDERNSAYPAYGHCPPKVPAYKIL
jgi:hypothetical protein